MSKITVDDLYRLCFCYPELRKQLKEDWHQIYDWLIEEQGNKVERDLFFTFLRDMVS